MLLMVHVLQGGTIGVFARFCALFVHVLRGLDDFPDGFVPEIGPVDDCLYCALLGNNYRQWGPGFFCDDCGLFCQDRIQRK